MVNERHAIWIKRHSGEPKPWSMDPIFQEWKFCNVFRELDKQSVYLSEILQRHWDAKPGLLLFNVFVFRAFNLYDTYKSITEPEKFITEWDEEYVIQALSQLDKLTSGAYMIRGYEGIPKYVSIPQTLSVIWKDRDWLAKEIYDHGSLEYAVDLIVGKKYWGWGPFTSYQVTLDLMQTAILENPRDLNTWCAFGPGAIRGLEIIFPGIRKEQYLPFTRELWSMQGQWLKDYMPIMSLQDIEFSLCEFQKYWRIMNGGRSKERYSGAR